MYTSLIFSPLLSSSLLVSPRLSSSLLLSPLLSSIPFSSLSVNCAGNTSTLREADVDNVAVLEVLDVELEELGMQRRRALVVDNTAGEAFSFNSLFSVATCTYFMGGAKMGAMMGEIVL